MPNAAERGPNAALSRGGAALEKVLQRDRAIVVAAMAAITLLAWAYLLLLAHRMEASMAAMESMPAAGMEMPGMEMPGMADMAVAPQSQPWTPTDFALVLAMWVVMMVGMMTPSAAPMILLYARVARAAVNSGKMFASTAWFASGYLSAWAIFSLLAAAAQWALERGALLTPMMALRSGPIGSAVMIAAGLYQWSAAKNACLAHCQSPLAFLQQHGGFPRDRKGALRLGAHHGAYCVGCCWALMALLFIGGVMNILWIAALTVLVLLEKVVPAGKLVPRIAGVLLVTGGFWWLLRG